MIRMSALRETITVFALVSSGEDEYGDVTYGEGSGVESPAAVEPLAATEDEIGRDTRVQRYRFTVPPTLAVDGTCRVEWRGKSFSVLGEPLLRNAMGDDVHHLEFEAREIIS